MTFNSNGENDMDMSKAALPPKTGFYSRADQAHPLFNLYRQHLSSCAHLLIDASDFSDWLFQYNRNAESDSASKHERFIEFQNWCREVKAGGRPCCPTKDNPNGLCFPHNFYYWLQGGRW